MWRGLPRTCKVKTPRTMYGIEEKTKKSKGINIRGFCEENWQVSVKDPMLLLRERQGKVSIRRNRCTDVTRAA